jgi:hypothetical protein
LRTTKRYTHYSSLPINLDDASKRRQGYKDYHKQYTHQLIGGVVFADMQSVSNWPGNKIDAVWPGEGLGIRIKINKHSATNVAVDYAWGSEGSRGFFVNLGEVF